MQSASEETLCGIEAVDTSFLKSSVQGFYKQPSKTSLGPLLSPHILPWKNSVEARRLSLSVAQIIHDSGECGVHFFSGAGWPQTGHQRGASADAPGANSALHARHLYHASARVVGMTLAMYSTSMATPHSRE